MIFMYFGKDLRFIVGLVLINSFWLLNGSFFFFFGIKD